MAKITTEYRKTLIEQLGYDPLDYSWVEKELAETPLEKAWFKYQREHKGFNDDWETTVSQFKERYKLNITVEEAYDLCRKWKRYLIGSWNTIASQNPNIEDWKQSAQEFEIYHREIETRMMEWSLKYQNKYPLTKVIKPIQFRHGPYFNECVERVPFLFTDATCSAIRPDVILEIVSFDQKEKYIRLEFTPDIKNLIKPNIPINNPWKPLKADYIIYCPPFEAETHLQNLTDF